MRLLFDTNIFLEIIFNQPKASVAQKALASAGHTRFITIFSLHSIGLLLLRHRLYDRWPLFLKDMITNGFVTVLTLGDEDLAKVLDVARRYSLDFDDAYQYATADAHDLTLVSFDKDFDRTPRRRLKPQRLINKHHSS